MFPFQLLIAALSDWLHREQADVIAFLREENRLLKARPAGHPLGPKTRPGADLDSARGYAATARAFLIGWFQRGQSEIIEYLRDENRVLKAQLCSTRVRLTDDKRRRWPVLGTRLGRQILVEVATIVTPETILRWHLTLIARKWPYQKRGRGWPGVLVAIRRLAVRMAIENPSWGYGRIPCALKNLGHRVARSTIAAILKQQGVHPGDERPTSRPTFLRAHWDAVVAADFFTTEAWTLRGLVTHYTAFVIELQTRRVHILGSAPHPAEPFVLQIARHVTDPTDRVGDGPSFLVCDRNQKWSTAVRQLFETSGVRVIRTPFRAPNCTAHAERFVRSIKKECLNRVIPLGERYFRRALAEFVAHYHRDRDHQGLGNELIDGGGDAPHSGPARRPHHIEGLLNYYYYYYRAA